MGFLQSITKVFNSDGPPSRRRMLNCLARMDTPEGAQEFLRIVAAHPELVNFCDKQKKSALYLAARAEDVDTMDRIIKAGIQPHFFHDAIFAASYTGIQAALDLLLNAGASVVDEHLEVTRLCCDHYHEGMEDYGTGIVKKIAGKYDRALLMLKAAQGKQEEMHAADEKQQKQIGPLVLTDKISVRRPLKFRSRASFA